MQTSIHHAKAYLLLNIIYYYARTASHSANIAFFAISDYIECRVFMREINVSLAELVEIVDFLYKAGFVRFIEVLDTIFVFLTEKGCHFVLTEHDGFMECSKHG